MRITAGVEMLELSADLSMGPAVIYPTLIWDENTAILVDTGLPGLLPQIREAIEKAGAPFEKLRQVIITHHDMDHIGTLSGILNKAPGTIKLLAHEAEKPYIQGDKTPLKMTAERLAQLESLPEEKRREMRAMYVNKVDQTLTDGEELPYCGGITVIHTPGHTHGHICLYLRRGKILISGDALNASNGKLLGPAPQFTFDMDQALKSLKKLNQYNIEAVICYHGGLCRGNINRRIAELTKD